MGEANEATTSNAFRLDGRQWAGVLLLALAVVLLAPRVWPRVEKLEAGPEYRIPHELGADYWLWGRLASQAAATHDTLLLGDSVVWGEYVRPDETLSHYLNALEGRDRYANLSVPGCHPAALAGLIEHYGRAIRGKRVVIQCNPLWMSSPKHDLRGTEEFKFNHSTLVPQFAPAIPCYREETSRRLGKIVERNVPFSAWTNHLQAAYFGNASVPAWTLEHPYENPLAPLAAPLPAPDAALRHEPISWTARGIPPENMPWVDLSGSLQWASFRRALDLLESRGNAVFVVVGPFNEHLLTPASRERYASLKLGIEGWLRERKIAFVVPPPLPSEQYGDASHPLSAGYALLAKQLGEGFLLSTVK
jgi:hypothetical protein